MAEPTTFEKVIKDAITQATAFPKLMKEAERILELIEQNDWDQVGSILPDMLTAEMLRIEPPRADEEERRLLVLARLGTGLRAFLALQQFLDTPLPGLVAPEAAIRGFTVDFGTLGGARDLTDDPPPMTPRRAIGRMGLG